MERSGFLRREADDLTRRLETFGAMPKLHPLIQAWSGGSSLLALQISAFLSRELSCVEQYLVF